MILMNKPLRPSSRDPGFVVIVLLVSLTAAWVLLMPFFPAVASATMRRFHLRSDSYLFWAIQSPIPTMYNFANTFQVRKVPHGEPDPEGEPTVMRYANHFPMRVVTFADTRNRFLSGGQDRWYTLRSSYRGQSIVSRIHVKKKGEGRFDVLRVFPERSP